MSWFTGKNAGIAGAGLTVITLAYLGGKALFGDKEKALEKKADNKEARGKIHEDLGEENYKEAIELRKKQRDLVETREKEEKAKADAEAKVAEDKADAAAKEAKETAAKAKKPA